jgi:hypothetical protein
MGAKVHELSPYNKIYSFTFSCSPRSYFYFYFIVKMILLNVIRPLKVYQNIKYHGPTLTEGSFTTTSEV